MRSTLHALGLAAMICLAVSGGSAAAGSNGKHRPAARLFAIGHASLVGVDPDTLRPLSGGRLKLGDNIESRELSPSRRLLALGEYNDGGVELVNLATLRMVGRIPLVSARPDALHQVDLLSWRSPNRLVAVVSADLGKVPGRSSLAVTDPRTHSVHTLHLRGYMLDHARLRGRGGVLLMRPARGIGPARLLVVSPGGNVRQVELSRVRAGTGKPVGAAPPGTTRELSPALAVDRTGRHAYVVGTGRVVAAVDLATLSTTYHQVPGLKSHLLMGRVRMTGTVEQQQGHTRRATWLSGGTLLVSGITEVPASDGRARWGRTPDRLVSTTTWRIVRELPRHVWPASRTTLLRQPRDDKGHVTVYRADGSAALTLPGAWATVAGARLFAGTIGVSHVHEYDVATGRNLGPVDGAWFTGTELRPLIAWRPPTISR